MDKSKPPISLQHFDYFIVLDFEATCNENRNRGMKAQEIIEFPSVLINAKTLEVEDEFQVYVKPEVHPKLTDFCTKLTGIRQDKVDTGKTFQEAFAGYLAWLESKGLTTKFTFAFVTCGDWDLKTMLPKQCQLSGIKIPPIFMQWVNIKHVFQSYYHKKPGGMVQMLNYLAIQLTGRHHSGIDDCRNITKILQTLIQDGAVVNLTWEI